MPTFHCTVSNLRAFLNGKDVTRSCREVNIKEGWVEVWGGDSPATVERRYGEVHVEEDPSIKVGCRVTYDDDEPIPDFPDYFRDTARRLGFVI